jgi:hypothetical protein
MVEDSENRLWSLGEYYNLKYYSDVNNSWTAVDFMGWGANIRKDPTRAGTIWACSGYQVLRTDGTYNYSKTVNNFQELDPQSDVLSTVIPAPDGIAWVGSNQGLFRLNANNNTYQFFSPGNSQIPGENITPLACTPDGRIWFTNFGSTNTAVIGLCWFDGTQFGIFPVQDGGLPHAQIADMEVKEHQNGYELWMSCLSRGIAVLDVLNSTVGISPQNITESIDYFQNYPNPINGKTNFQFSVSTPGMVNLSVFDLTGNLVVTLLDEYTAKGEKELVWHVSGRENTKVTPGFYIARLSTPSQTKSMKIIIK